MNPTDPNQQYPSPPAQPVPQGPPMPLPQPVDATAPLPPVAPAYSPAPQQPTVTPGLISPTAPGVVAPQPMQQPIPQPVEMTPAPVLPAPEVAPQPATVYSEASFSPVVAAPVAAVPGVQAQPYAVEGKSFIVAWLLNILLGSFGADRFYLGYIGTGVLKLVTAGGLGIWNLIDLIRLLTGNLHDKSGRELSGRKEHLTLAAVITFVVILLEIASSGLWLSVVMHSFKNVQTKASADAVVVWANDGAVEDSYNAIANDLNQAATDSSANNMTGLRTDCQALQTDVATAQKLPAAPSVIAADLTPALNLINQGAEDCVNGVNASDATTVNKGITEFNQAEKHLQTMSDTISKYRASS